MDKEKEIQEMAREICKIQYGDECEDGCKVRQDNGRLCECGQYAETLYNAGYRKADEVRKETAKEILAIVNHYEHYTWNDFSDVIKDICKKYGVEIDE